MVVFGLTLGFVILEIFSNLNDSNSLKKFNIFRVNPRSYTFFVLNKPSTDITECTFLHWGMYLYTTPNLYSVVYCFRLKCSSDLQHWSDTRQTNWYRTLPLYLGYVWWARRTNGAWKISSHRNVFCHLFYHVWQLWLQRVSLDTGQKRWVCTEQIHTVRNILIEDSLCHWYDSHNEIENICLRYLSPHSISTRIPKSEHKFLLANNKNQ